jgi:hypothetical protein
MFFHGIRKQDSNEIQLLHRSSLIQAKPFLIRYFKSVKEKK